jgi:hypothetical protein
VLIAAGAVTFAACSGPVSPHIASLGKPPGTSANSTVSASPSSSTVPANGNATKLVDEWAACMRSNGDPNQADPVIDAHGVIHIIGPLAGPGVPRVVGGPETPTGTCSQYLAAAQSVLRAAMPVAPPPTEAELIKYVDCMRANGVPNYPYPTGEKADFNATGVDPNSPFVVKAGKVCGQQIGAPPWWTNGWGPPGDVSVEPPQGVLPPRPAQPAGGAG